MNLWEMNYKKMVHFNEHLSKFLSKCVAPNFSVSFILYTADMFQYNPKSLDEIIC